MADYRTSYVACRPTQHETLQKASSSSHTNSWFVNLQLCVYLKNLHVDCSAKPLLSSESNKVWMRVPVLSVQRRFTCQRDPSLTRDRLLHIPSWLECQAEGKHSLLWAMQEARPEGLRLPVFRELIHNERPWKAMNPKASYVMHVIAAMTDVIAKVYRGKQASQNSHVHQFPTQSIFFPKHRLLFLWPDLWQSQGLGCQQCWKEIEAKGQGWLNLVSVFRPEHHKLMSYLELISMLKWYIIKESQNPGVLVLVSETNYLSALFQRPIDRGCVLCIGMWQYSPSE